MNPTGPSWVDPTAPGWLLGRVIFQYLLYHLAIQSNCMDQTGPSWVDPTASGWLFRRVVFQCVYCSI